MNYMNALKDTRVQYAAATGRVDDRNEQEVITFLENIMQEAKPKHKTDNGYIIIDNGYAYFARKIERGIEAAKETDLETVLDLIDQGQLRQTGRDASRGATYYEPELATLKQLEKLLGATEDRLNIAIVEYTTRINKHKETFSMKESVSHLTHRVSLQKATIAYLKSHQ